MTFKEELLLELKDAPAYVLSLGTCREMAQVIRSGRYDAEGREYLIDSLTGDALEACLKRAPDSDTIAEMVLGLRMEFLPTLQV